MIELRDVAVSFQGRPVLAGASLHVRPGEFVSLVGETGAGKTTLLRLIYFDLRPERGEVRVGTYTAATIRRAEIPLLRRTLGIVFQDLKLLDDRSVGENVAFALEVTGARREEIAPRVAAALASVGLAHAEARMPSALSGGERQRVVIARALVNRPDALLADEPSGHLDPATTMEILHLLRAINAAGTTVLLASHNYDLVRKSESRILKLAGGAITEITPGEL